MGSFRGFVQSARMLFSRTYYSVHTWAYKVFARKLFCPFFFFHVLSLGRIRLVFTVVQIYFGFNSMRGGRISENANLNEYLLNEMFQKRFGWNKTHTRTHAKTKHTKTMMVTNFYCLSYCGPYQRTHQHWMKCSVLFEIRLRLSRSQNPTRTLSISACVDDGTLYYTTIGTNTHKQTHSILSTNQMNWVLHSNWSE